MTARTNYGLAVSILARPVLMIVIAVVAETIDAATTFSDAADIRLTGTVTIKDLPSGVEKRPPPGTSAQALSELLAHQPSVVLDGGTLVISAPDLGSTRSLMFNRLELLHGAQIVTNGINLEIDASLIVSDGGAVVAFQDEPTGRTPAVAGRSGESGLNAATLVLESELNRNDILHVRLNGQAGQPGGAGVRGPTGTQGPQGVNAADHLFDCARGGGTGGPGAKGGQGGGGGRGGVGGAGGKLLLRGKIAQQRVQIDFVAPGGQGGRGGEKGQGGDGGPGGSGGNGSTYCHGGNAGTRGEIGEDGKAGENGDAGQAGSILAD